MDKEPERQKRIFHPTPKHKNQHKTKKSLEWLVNNKEKEFLEFWSVRAEKKNRRSQGKIPQSEKYRKKQESKIKKCWFHITKVTT